MKAFFAEIILRSEKNIFLGWPQQIFISWTDKYEIKLHYAFFYSAQDDSNATKISSIAST